MITLFCQRTVVSKPLLPTFIHDDFSSILGILLSAYIFKRLADYYNA
jgi:hypothetical protein